MARKPEATFVMRLVGNGVKPELVSLRRLVGALNAIQRLVAPVDTDADDRESEEDLDGRDSPQHDLPLHLMDVRRTSAAYPVFAAEAEKVLERLKLVGRVEQEPEVIAPYRGSVSALEELSNLARTLNCKIELRRPETGDDAILATIQAHSFDALRDSLYLKGPTSFVATVERAGGKVNRHCGLRLPQQPRKQLTCSVANEDLVRDLGQALYKEVTVHGIATWYQYDWWITNFHIQSMSLFEPLGAKEAMEELRDAAGGAWDSVSDPEALLAEIRG